MNIKYLDPKEDVIEYIINNINVETPEKYLIVFPGNRPRLFLLKSLSERLKRSFIPPQIYSFEDFIEFLALKINSGINRISEDGLISYLYNLNIQNNTFNRHKEHLSLFLPFARKVIQDYTLIVKSGTIQRLRAEKEEIIGEIKKTDIYDTVKDYTEIICALDDIIKKNNHITDAELFQIASDIGEAGLKEIFKEFEHIFLVDIIPLYTTESRILENILNLSNTMLILQKSQYLNLFPQLKTLIKHDKIEADFITKDINIYESPDIHAQVLMLKNRLLKDIKEKAQGSIAPDTLIMLPDSKTLKILNNTVLSEESIKGRFNVSIGVPISGMQMSQFFNILFKLLKDISINATELNATLFYLFLQHKYILALKDKKNPTIKPLAERVYNELSQKIYEIIDIDNFYKDYNTNELLKKIIEEIIFKVREIKSIKDFSEYICNVITFISNNHNGSLNYGYFNIESARIYERFKGLSQSEMKGIPIRSSEFLSVFNNIIYGLNITPSGTPLSGIQVLGVYESRTIRFKDVYILDFNDEVVFNYNFEDSYFPVNIKDKLDIPSRASHDNYILYFLDILFSQSERINVFYRGEDRLTKNRYLLRYIFERRKKRENTKIEPIIYKIDLKPSKPMPIDKNEDIIARIKEDYLTATKLNTYIKCPAQFYYSVILGLEEREDIDEEVGHDIYGKIIHDTLKEYFEPFINKSCKIIDENIKKLLKVNFEKYISYSSSKYLIDYSILEVAVENFIRHYNSDELFNKSKILELEKEHKTEITIDNSKIKLRGRFDRVDKIRDTDGKDKYHIFDYKFATSGRYKILTENLNTLEGKKFNMDDEITVEFIEKRKHITNQKNIQLPLYIYLASRDSSIKCKLKDLTASFLFLKELGTKKFIETISDNETNYSDDIVESVIKEILNPEIPFFPCESDYSCRKCDFYSLCHKGV